MGRPAIEATVEVPTAIAEIRQSDPKQAREIQKTIGDRFQKLFGMGLAVIGFERSEYNPKSEIRNPKSFSSYLLGFWK